ncbi:hypothetical protein Tco_0331212 [Tanacetum coccineum]
MVVIDDHDTGEGLIPNDVFDVGEGSNTTAHEEIDESDVESDRHDPDFRPSPKGTPYWVPCLPEDEKPNIGDVFDTFDAGYDMYKAYAEKGKVSKT